MSSCKIFHNNSPTVKISYLPHSLPISSTMRPSTDSRTGSSGLKNLSGSRLMSSWMMWTKHWTQSRLIVYFYCRIRGYSARMCIGVRHYFPCMEFSYDQKTFPLTLNLIDRIRYEWHKYILLYVII